MYKIFNEVVPGRVLVLGICLLLSMFVKREFAVQFFVWSFKYAGSGTALLGLVSLGTDTNVGLTGLLGHPRSGFSLHGGAVVTCVEQDFWLLDGDIEAGWHRGWGF